MLVCYGNADICSAINCHYQRGFIMVGHLTFDDQSACWSSQNMFGSDINNRPTDIGRCKNINTNNFLIFMLLMKTLHLVARKYYMVPAQDNTIGM